jgi:DNA-directed RNA polymerase specialized sigma24 family protein
MLRHKPVSNRKSRPAWAMDRKTLALRAFGKAAIRRWHIAQAYWIENKSAREIARELRTSIGSVKRTIHTILTRS